MTHIVSRGRDFSPCFCILELVRLAATHRLVDSSEAAGLFVLAGKHSGGEGFPLDAGPCLGSLSAGVCLKIPRRLLLDPSSGSAHWVGLVGPGRCCSGSHTSDQTLALPPLSPVAGELGQPLKCVVLVHKVVLRPPDHPQKVARIQ